MKAAKLSCRMAYLEDFEIEDALAAAGIEFERSKYREWRIGGTDIYLIAEDDQTPPLALIRRPFSYQDWLEHPNLSQGVQSVEEGLSLEAAVVACKRVVQRYSAAPR
jgi:hypothetical protein